MPFNRKRGEIFLLIRTIYKGRERITGLSRALILYLENVVLELGKAASKHEISIMHCPYPKIPSPSASTVSNPSSAANQPAVLDE